MATTFNFNDKVGQTVTFATSDVLSIAGGAAKDIVATDVTGGLQLTLNGQSVVLSGMSLQAVTTTNIVFADGSRLWVGNNDTVTGATDDAGVTIGGGVLASGANQIIGGAGVDNITGGTGADKIIGNGGADVITGGAGANTISGGAGDDVVTATALSIGNDVVRGGADNDTIDYHLSTGDNLLIGNLGVDSIISGAGNDTIISGAGADVVDVSVSAGSSAHQTIDTGDDADTVTLGAATYRVLTGGDKDTVNGGAGSAFISLGAGDDSAVNTDATALAATVLGGLGNDHIDYASVASTAANSLVGGAGNETVEGGDGNDMLVGGVGDDVLTSGSSASTLQGGDGKDNLTGGIGGDILAGGAGDDTISGGGGADTIAAGAGDNTITVANASSAVVHMGVGHGTNTVTIATFTGQGDFITMDGFKAGTDAVTLGAVTASTSALTAHQTSAGLIIANSSDSLLLQGITSGVVTVTGGTAGVFHTNAGATSVTMTSAAAGADKLLAGNGGDTLLENSAGGAGVASNYVGGNGNDVIKAGLGTLVDTLDGGAGNDSITTSNDDSRMNGGTGTDTLHMIGVAQTLVIDGTAAADGKVIGVEKIDFVSGSSTGSGHEVVTAAAADYVGGDITANSVVTIDGSGIASGGDLDVTDNTVNLGVHFSITGSAGADTVLLSTTTIAATISGGAGQDVLTGSQAADIITGGEGADTITGGIGADTIILTESSSAADDIVIGTTTAFGDKIIGFTSATDDIDYNVANLNANNGGAVGGAAAVISALNGSQTTGTHIYIVDATYTATGTTAATALVAIEAAAGGTYTAENAADYTLFAVKDSDGSIRIWAADVNSSVADTAITADELTLVAVLSGTSTVVAGDFI